MGDSEPTDGCTHSHGDVQKDTFGIGFPSSADNLTHSRCSYMPGGGEGCQQSFPPLLATNN